MVQNGVVVDLSLFNEVTPSVDRSTVTVGTGSRWLDVYKALDDKGLVVIGGRSSPVGVGGLTLQGGISFYSPRFGFVCSNAVSYEVVLANGSCVTASATEHPDLWRVLKGGGNNFGIVTRFTLRSMPSAPLWVGRMFSPAWQHAKALKTYHDYLDNASSSQPGGFDENAASPILSFVYIQAIGLQLIASHFVYTKAPEDKERPTHWKDAGFTSLWSFYRTSKVQSHTSAVEELGRTSHPGTFHTMCTTTVRNNLETMTAAYAIFCMATKELRQVKGLLLPFTFQSILPGWMNKGDPNVLGLDGCTEPLIIINCLATWTRAEDDELVRSILRRTFEQIDKAAEARQSDHSYRFMNYCAMWQRPFEGCGKENLKIMREASRKYDPEGLFQSGCTGGFKLDTEYSKA